MFDHIVGNLEAKTYLSHLLSKRVIGNSFLFGGAEGVGKGMFAQEFAKSVICLDDPDEQHRLKLESGSHPDLHIYRPEGKIGMHSIDAMRLFSQEVYMPPLEAKRKVFIVLDAERMLPYSANALLKTFEEPSADSVIILVSSQPSALLTTILSRCRKLYFHTLTEAEVGSILEQKGIPADQAFKIASLAQGSVSQALRLIQPEFADRRMLLLQVLARGRFKDYAELTQLAQEIAKEVEGASQEYMTLLQEQYKKGFIEKPTAVQQSAIDKEIEGSTAMREKAEAQSIFQIILSWYRDLEVLAVGQDKAFLINKEFYDELIQTRQRGISYSLDRIFQVIKDGQLALERSTNLSICLESLFLKIGLL